MDTENGDIKVANRVITETLEKVGFALDTVIKVSDKIEVEEERKMKKRDRAFLAEEQNIPNNIEPGFDKDSFDEGYKQGYMDGLKFGRTDTVKKLRKEEEQENE